ncbi:DUF423 domain-containing protein [Bernardetia sp. ABR2-2B]|uniref:DUF423 domain-containing protein n=1 Tax=Bernardetia sp. ABR2-2B TaxID=3127472 RepID=UPI0030CC1CEF
MKNNFIFWGAILGALAVGVGGFITHFSDIRLEIFQTALIYHFAHSLSIILIGFLIKTDSVETDANDSKKSNTSLIWAGNLHLFGTLLLSGSLYLSSTSSSKIGIFAFIGGFLLILGWLFLALYFYNKK